MSQWRALNAIVELRRLAADVVNLADMAIYAQKDGEKAVAIRMLPGKIRQLQFRAQRALTALEEGGTRGR
jgi:hypothetical protein